MKKKCLLVKEEDGAIIVLVALLMVVLLSISALVVDAGGLYLEKSRVQKAVDAAVLAGAQELPSTSSAQQIAIDVANKNGVVIDANDISVTASSIEVITETKKELTFARIMGFSTANVAASAKAGKGGTIGGTGFLPLTVVESAFKKGDLVSLALTTNDASKGNFQYVRFPDTTLAENITNGYKGYLSIGMKLDTEPGNNTSSSHVRNAINGRINDDIDKLYCDSYQTADKSCSRLIYIPMVDTMAVQGSSQQITIVGFAAFLLNDNPVGTGNNAEIKGYFMDSVFPGTIGTPTLDFGLSSLKLVN